MEISIPWSPLFGRAQQIDECLPARLLGLAGALPGLTDEDYGLGDARPDLAGVLTHTRALADDRGQLVGAKDSGNLYLHAVLSKEKRPEPLTGLH